MSRPPRVVTFPLARAMTEPADDARANAGDAGPAEEPEAAPGDWLLAAAPPPRNHQAQSARARIRLPRRPSVRLHVRAVVHASRHGDARRIRVDARLFRHRVGGRPLKFWKKRPRGRGVRGHQRAHSSEVLGLCVSADGAMCATIGEDNTCKVFDVVNFDMIMMLKLDFNGGQRDHLSAKRRRGRRSR